VKRDKSFKRAKKLKTLVASTVAVRTATRKLQKWVLAAQLLSS